MPDPPQKPPRPAAYTQEVDSEAVGQRLDNFLLRILKGVPRSHVYHLIRSGQVRVNSGRVRASYRVRVGDRVRIPPVSQRQPLPAAIPKDRVQWLAERILYENSRILVLDKPSGMPVHGGSGVSFGCIEAVRSLRPALRSADLVHRLDRGTSGCLLIAKRRSALRLLHRLFREGSVEKRYLALLRGAWQHGQVQIDLPLSIQRREGESHVRVDRSGYAARSRFRLVETYRSLASLVEVTIETGRTHQIRVHAGHSGHPVAGDERYGDEEFNTLLGEMGLHRLFLHAHAIGFTWPDSEQPFSVSTPLPEELSAVLEALSVPSGGRR